MVPATAAALWGVLRAPVSKLAAGAKLLVGLITEKFPPVRNIPRGRCHPIWRKLNRTSRVAVTIGVRPGATSGAPAVRSIIVAATLLIAFMATARADFQDAVAAYKRGDYATALREWRPFAEQADAGAQFNLGLMYSKGQGVPQDYAEAVKWYRLAAEQGYADAQNNLGLKYDLGQGVPQDYVQAHLWYNLAAAQGNELASKNRDIVADRMTPAQIAEAQRLAREWKPKIQ